MNSENAPSVSVIIPTFNRLELLRKTVESLSAQSLKNCEFLLVDDRSEEFVRNYLQTLPLLDPRFRVLLKQANELSGCQASRNIGLEQCLGTWLMFLDSDDLLASDCLEQRLTAISRSPGFDIYIGNQAIFRESTGKSTWVNVPSNKKSELDRFMCIAAPIDIPWVNGGCFFRTSSLLGKGIKWHTGFHWDDVWFHIQCLIEGMSVFWLPRTQTPDSWYRLHGTEHYGNTLHTEEGKANSATMVLRLAKLLKEKGLLDKQRAMQLSRVLFNIYLLPLIDVAKWTKAYNLLDLAEENELLIGSEWKHLRTFVRLRKLTLKSSKATFFVNRFAKNRFLAHAFDFASVTYDTNPTTSPTLES